MQSVRPRFLVPFLVVGAVIVPACSSGDVEVDDEQASSADQLTSGSAAVDCSERQDVAYVAGKPHNVSVITVGGKPATKTTAHAFLRFQNAAIAAGVQLGINSGFRTQREQQYLYDCYTSRSCNNGNLAARPGFSNHQSGYALDLATTNWSWVAQNASRFGFAATVPSERWHYEYRGADPGGACSGQSQQPQAPADPGGGPSSDAETPGDPLPPVPEPKPPVPEPKASCYSSTLGRSVSELACVWSDQDNDWEQCHLGKWYRGVYDDNTGPYGACSEIVDAP
jgi:hypothetical protein